MQDQPLKVSIFGHSFVRRLSQYVQSDVDCSNLGLDPTKFNVHIYGIGGLSLMHSQLHSFDQMMKDSDILFVDVGSNDLCRLDVDVHTFVSTYVSYLSSMKENLNIKTVLVCQLFHRKVQPYNGYNEKVDLINTLLAEKLQLGGASKLFFWKHQCGLWHYSQSNIFSPDGIHLSWNIGYPKYVKSVRDGVLRMKNRL